jgi:hypothetical protein
MRKRLWKSIRLAGAFAKGFGEGLLSFAGGLFGIPLEEPSSPKMKKRDPLMVDVPTLLSRLEEKRRRREAKQGRE